MRVVLNPEQQALLLEAVEYGLGRGLRVHAFEPVEVARECAVLTERRDDREVELLAEEEVFLAAARGDVDDAGSFGRAHLIPRNHAVLDALLGSEFVKRASVLQADQLLALEFLDDLRPGAENGEEGFREDVDVAVLARAHVLEFGVDCGGDIGRQGPRRGRPDEQVLMFASDDRESEVDRPVGQFAIALGSDFLVGDSGSAA